VVRDDRLGTGQWPWVGGASRREREVYRESEVGCQVDAVQPLEGLVESPGWNQCDREVTTGLAEGLSCPEKDRCNNYSLGGGFLHALKEWISGFHDRLRTRPSSLFMLLG
jgi:hypothetical protein